MYILGSKQVGRFIGREVHLFPQILSKVTWCHISNKVFAIPSPGDLPNLGIKPKFDPGLQAYSLPSEPPGKP